jgi:hypothetical protein
MYSPSPRLIFTEEGQALAHPKGGVGDNDLQPPQKQNPKDTHFVDKIIYS